MSEKQELDEQSAHKYFSAYCFNQAWDFIDKKERNGEEEVEMLLTSMASLWHWKQRKDVTATELSVGYWQVARVYTLLGQAENARQFGLLSLEESQQKGVTPFYLGYSYEALARAAALAGEKEQMAAHLKLAREAMEKMTDQEAKGMLLDDLASIG